MPKAKSTLPAFPEGGRVPPNQPDQVEVLEYDADGEFVGQTLTPLADYDPETVPVVPAETNIGGFQQADGHGWSEEDLEAKEDSAAI